MPVVDAEIEVVDDTTLHWVASIAGGRREWDARITQPVRAES